jgi:hypothetical protein
LSVRKRVIKLLKAIYPVVTLEAKVDICKSLLTRLNDEDDNVKVSFSPMIDVFQLTLVPGNGHLSII